MAKRRHSLVRRRHLGSASKGSSTGWLIGIGAVAAVIGGVWYWRSRRREKLIRSLECAIENMRDNLQNLRLSRPAADPANITRLVEEIFILQNELWKVQQGGEPSEAALRAVTDWCPQS